MRVTSSVHPLFGRVLDAGGFKRIDGVLFLVVELPDGSPGTVAAEATNVFGDGGVDEAEGTVLSVEGVRGLRALVRAVLGDVDEQPGAGRGHS